jgi:hypothetical protein
MKKTSSIAFLVLLCAVMVNGCYYGYRGPVRRTVGTVAGATAGAVIGGTRGVVRGAVVGGLVGAGPRYGYYARPVPRAYYGYGY